MKKLLFIPLAASMLFFSCKKEQKEQVKNVDDFVSQQKDNQYRSSLGSIKATISGKVDSALSDYKGVSYSWTDKAFKYTNDNVNNSATIDGRNLMTTSRSTFVDENDETQSYTTESFNIRMYEFDGQDLDNDNVDNYVNIEFVVYSGTLTQDMMDQGYETGIPQDIYVTYSMSFKPEENSITCFNVSQTISPEPAQLDFVNGGYLSEKNERVDIDNWEFDMSNGKIMFDFNGSNSELDTDPDIEGSVDTFILKNTILSEFT